MKDRYKHIHTHIHACTHGHILTTLDEREKGKLKFLLETTGDSRLKHGKKCAADRVSLSCIYYAIHVRDRDSFLKWPRLFRSGDTFVLPSGKVRFFSFVVVVTTPSNLYRMYTIGLIALDPSLNEIIVIYC